MFTLHHSLDTTILAYSIVASPAICVFEVVADILKALELLTGV